MKITKEVKIGAVVIATIIAFFFLFNFLKGKNLFVSGDVYYVKYADVEGLSSSKPVSINGLRVGRIESIEVVSDVTPIHFVVKLSVDKGFEFSKNTVAEIFEPGIMSGPEIRLLLDYTGASAKSGDTLSAGKSSGMMDKLSTQLGPTQTRLDSVLITLNQALHGVDQLLHADNQQNLKSLLINLNTTVDEFSKTAKSISHTSDAANNLIAKNDIALQKTLSTATEALASSKVTLDKYGQTADKINALELEKTLSNFEQASSQLNALLTSINNGEGSLGALAKDKEMYENLNSASKNLDLLIEDFKTNPNKYVQFSVFGKKQKTQE